MIDCIDPLFTGRYGQTVSFIPLRLLLVADPAFGYCGRVLPRMKQLLEDRAFQVDEVLLDPPPRDLEIEPYDGLILGIPVPGLGLRGGGVSPRMAHFVDSLGDLDGVRVVLFCVYVLRPGDTLASFRDLLEAQGADVLVAREVSVFSPDRDEHVIPAECMVRIR